NKDTVIIEVRQGPDMAGQPDVLTCPNYEVGLNLGVVKQTGATYTYNWTPTTGLSSSTVEDPKVKLKSPVTYYVSVGSDVNRCKTLDTILVDVLTGMSIENPDTAICLGQSVDVRGIGDSRYNYSWTSTENNPAYSNPGSILNTITPSDTGVHKYVVHAQHPNCPNVDSTLNFDIDVQPNPSVDRKSTRLNSSHVKISYAVFCLKKKKTRYRKRRNET